MTVKLRYLKKSLQMMGQKYYNLIEPKLPEYNYDLKNCYPTFSLKTLKDKGLLNVKTHRL